MSTVIVWFRQDLRLEDNPAWNRAVESGTSVIPVYIWSPEEAGKWVPGGASRWWLHHALEDLAVQLADIGSRLILRTGESVAEIERLVADTGAMAVYWNRCYEPHRMRIDGRMKSRLKEGGIEAWTGNSALLREPWEVSTGQGKPYKVFTPWYRACMKLREREPLLCQGRPGNPDHWPDSVYLGDLGLLPRVDWADGLAAFWEPTRQGGLERMRDFLDGAAQSYKTDRDEPALDGTSRFSPYLHWGQLGPREVAAALEQRKGGEGVEAFHRELLWREFAIQVLYHFPDTPEKPLQLAYEKFPWKEDEEALETWRRGRTGFPLVDAGMRQLWETGWMHNRVRMVVASFLVKHLLQPWTAGAAWFWDTLVDADLANNTLGWQWAGGCGADAAPYFRIFNPTTQAEKFDSDGAYIRKYVPELENVPNRYIASPWEMPTSVQAACGCLIGRDYPDPMVDHYEARERALAALKTMKEQT